MESTIDAMAKAYDGFVAAITGVLQANEESGGQRTAGTESALENFCRQWELFKASCDRAEELVDSARKRIASEHAVDMACGMPAPAGADAAGFPAVSVPQLERALHAVHSLAAELRRKPEPSEDMTATSSSSFPAGTGTPSADEAQ